MLGSAYPVVLWVRAGADAFEGISKISGPRNGGEREIELEIAASKSASAFQVGSSIFSSASGVTFFQISDKYLVFLEICHILKKFMRFL